MKEFYVMKVSIKSFECGGVAMKVRVEVIRITAVDLPSVKSALQC